MKKRTVKLMALLAVSAGLIVQPMAVCANTGDGNVAVEMNADTEVTAAGNTRAADGEETGNAEQNTEGSEEQKPENAPLTGKWIKSKGRWWYQYSDQSYPAGKMLEIDGVKYAFDAKGWMVTGWYKQDADWYYFQKSGAMKTGWVKDKGKWYYLDPADGCMHAEKFSEISGKTYAFNKSGAMRTGWYKQDDHWYYFEKSGAMKSGWLKDKGKWYYLDPADGVMASDTTKVVEGKSYMFEKSGAMKTGWYKKDDVWYYLEKSGAMKTGWLKDKGKWYYLDPTTGVMSADCLEEIEGKTYAFKASGAMVTGLYEKKVKLNETAHMVTRYYYFEKSGAMKTGWVELGDEWRYFDPSTGIGYTANVYEINGKNYGFDALGVMATGWYDLTRAVVDEKTGNTVYVKDKYYFRKDGSAYHGWLTNDKDKFWINEDGCAAANGKYKVDKDRYAYFDEDAKFVKFE